MTQRQDPPAGLDLQGKPCQCFGKETAVIWGSQHQVAGHRCLTCGRTWPNPEYLAKLEVGDA